MKQVFALVVLLVAALGVRASTITAATCSRSDVNAVINGPTHTAVSGDVIIIPAGSCTWTSGIVVTVDITLQGAGTPNIGPGTNGAGITSTVITDNTSQALISFQGTTQGTTSVIGLLDVEPQSGATNLQSPIQFSGTCNSSGCPNVRIHNINYGVTTGWQASVSGQSTWLMRVDNAFGVVDHTTIGTLNDAVPIDMEMSKYKGVGDWGDNSWAQPNTFGGLENIYLENNVWYTGRSFTDCEVWPAGSDAAGGCRYVGRFNQLTSNNGFGGFGQHGLDTSGRARGGRQLEVYGNTYTCQGGSSCNQMSSYRAGTGYTFGNTMSLLTTSFINNITGGAVYREVFAPTQWGYCGGLTALDPFDTQANTVYFSGTMTTTGSGVLVFTDSSKSFTTNQLVPNGSPYSVYDTTQGFVSQIASNTATTVTVQGPISESTWTGFNNGDSYQIIRATVCVDQMGRGQGALVQNSTPVLQSTGLPGPVNETLTPVYEWKNSVSPVRMNSNVAATFPPDRIISNRDWYTDNWKAINGTGPTAQTSATSPFNGSGTNGGNDMGIGYGTFAFRPTTCTAGVGYFATDQGNWNTSGNGFGSGALYTCNSGGNAWTASYTPYAYPHPLTLSGIGTNSYYTNFPATENPISQGGVWLNGGTNGVDWTNIRTTTNFAFGTMTGSEPCSSPPPSPPANGCKDSKATYSPGTWAHQQKAHGKVHVTSTPSGGSYEIELFLLSAISANVASGYEANCSTNPSTPYVQLVRWNGGLGDFTYITGSGTATSCADGDEFDFVVDSSGNFTIKKNGATFFTGTDTAFTTGNPGIATFTQGSNLSANFGFSNWYATDGPAVLSTTTTVTGITSSGGSSGGNAVDQGFASITARGVCWSTSANPVVGVNCTTDGTGTGAFTSVMSTLLSSTLYHVRSYATNSFGTGYGPDVTFTTLTSGVANSVLSHPGVVYSRGVVTH